MTLFAPTILN